MRSIIETIAESCGEEDAKRINEFVAECVMLRSEWALLAEKGRGVILILSYIEDEPVIDKIIPVTIASADEGWEHIDKVIGNCPSPRLIKKGNLVISVCEEAFIPTDELKNLICSLEKPVVLCTHEWY